MENKELIAKIIQYIQLSSMEAREKAMWMILLPDMDIDHLTKLKNSLEKEVNALTDLYLNTMKPNHA